MPITRPSIQRTPVTPGKHVLTLRAVNEVESTNLYKKAPTDPDTVTRWVWEWTTDAKDAEGNSMEYTLWTGTGYGDSRATLTTLYDMILPGASYEEKANVNTDTLLGIRVEALIAMRQNKKGVMVPTHRYMAPIEGEAPKPVTTPGVDEIKAFDPDEIPF